jgi:drug/metabolite transporter (DMT)-like permease
VLRQAVARRAWLALALSLGGLALVAEVWRDAGLDPVGVAAGLGAAACLATFYLLGKHTVEQRDPLNLAFWMFTFAALFWAVVQPWWDFHPGVLAELAGGVVVLAGVVLVQTATDTPPSAPSTVQ